jgi:hypothetical protein
VDLTAFRNANGSVAIVALNTAASADPISYSLTGLSGLGTAVTPYLTDASSDTAAQAAVPVSDGAFTATIPARSLVTYVIPAGSTTTPTPGACTVTYTTQSQWAGGFVASVTIANPGSSPISGWALGFTFPGDQKITDAWNGVATQSGASVSVTNESYNATLAAGSSTSLGFQGTWADSDAPPASFTLNGTACTT